MPSVAKSYTVAAIEPTLGGMVPLLSPTAISSLPVSLTNSIPANANILGMRLLVRVWGHTAAGTITLTGTAPQTGGAQTETTTSLTVQETPGEFAEYTTTNLFQTISASSVILGSGLTNGTIAVYGIYGAKARTLLGETKFMDKFAEHSPQLQRGLYARDYNLIRLAHDPEWDFAGPLYGDNNVWMLQGAYSNNLTFTTIPASPVSVLASNPVATGGNTTTFVTQPTAPGMVIIIVLGGTAPATAASVTVAGTNQYGETVSEVVIPSTKIQGTYVSQTTFASVTQITWGAFGTGATIVVTAVFGYSAATSTQETDAVASFVLENYDSTASVTAPYCIIDEWQIEGGLDKEAKVTVKGPCQHIALVGDVTNGSSQITAYNQPVDEALTGWESLIFFDPASGSFGSTQQLDVVSWKVSKKGLWKKPIHKSIFNPPGREWGVVYRGYHELDVEFVLDMTQTTYQNEYINFQRRRRRFVRIQVRGPVLGTASGTTYYQGFVLDLPVEWITDATRDFSSGKESVMLTVKGKAYYDPAQGFAHKFTWYTRLPGW